MNATNWLADGPKVMEAQLLSIGVGSYRHVYCHADPDSSDPDFTGLVVVNDETHHAAFYWPHQASLDEALGKAELYAQVITGVRQRYPKAQVGIYALPNPAMWVNNNHGDVVHWGLADPEQWEQCTAWYIAALKPLKPVVDAIVVRCYEDLDTPQLAPNAALWSAGVEFARSIRDVWGMAGPTIDVVAFVSPFLMKGAPQQIQPKDAWLDRTAAKIEAIKPERVVCWSALDLWVKVAAMPPANPTSIPATLHARSLMASVLESMNVGAMVPDPMDHAAWASIEPLMSAAAASVTYTRLEAASFGIAAMKQSTDGWLPRSSVAPKAAAA